MLLKNYMMTGLFMLFAATYAAKADQILCDLSKTSTFNNWITKDGSAMNRLPQKMGNRYILSYKAPRYYRGSKNQWPAVIYTIPKQYRNWSNYDMLQVDCYLKTNNPVLVGAVFRDCGKKHFVEKHTVSQGGQWIRLSYKLQKNNIDLKRIRTVNFYVTRPGHDIEFYLSNIRLISQTPQKLAMLEKEYRRIGKNATANAISKASKNDVRKADEWFKNLRGAQIQKIRHENLKINPNAKFAVAVAGSCEKIFPKEQPVFAKSAEGYEISLARNEYEGFQIVAVAPENQELKDVGITAGKFTLQTAPHTALPAGAVQAFPIGFVKTRPPNYHTDYIGWYPDPILEHLKKINVKSNEVQPFWIRVKTENKTVPGIYSGSVSVKTANAGSIDIPVKIKVWDFVVPVKSKLKTATSVYGSPLLPARDKVYDFLLSRYRLNPFSIYSGSAYGKPTFPAIEEYTKRLKLGLNFIPMLYLKLPRQYMHKCSSKESKKKWAKMSPKEQKYYPEQGKKDYLAYLAKLVPEFKKAGIYDIAYCYGFDEAGPSEWPAIVDLCKTIKAKYPDLKIVTTAYDTSYGTSSVLGEVITGWIPFEDMYSPKLAAKARKNGKEVWWYSVRFYVDADPLWKIRSKMGEDGFKKRVDGFLYWTVTRWNTSNKYPITEAPYTNWNPMTYTNHNGGGSFFCAAPGKVILPTIRAEAIRDGIEDYEYYNILKTCSSKLNQDSPMKNQAEALLKAPVVHGAEKILERRTEIGNLIEKIKKQEK